MKLFLLFIIVTFAGVNISQATTVPVSKSSAAKKAALSTPVATGKKNATASKKKIPVAQKYKVRSGDTLYSIARRNGMKLANLQRLNGLKNSFLKPGQILLVTGKAKKAKKADNAQADEVVKGSGQTICKSVIPDDDGLSPDALSDVGVEAIARTYLSIPYRYGAQSRNSTDCSGFVRQVFREFDIQLPRTAREQYSVGTEVERASLASGDLLFFRTRAHKNYPTHVGIYLGNGKMIHASSRQHKVVISDVNHPYYVKRYVGAKRSATFLSDEIELEILARQVQVTGVDVDASLVAAIVADADMTASLEMEITPSSVLETGEDDQGDDIDTDIEPDAEAIVPAPLLLGTL